MPSHARKKKTFELVCKCGYRKQLPKSFVGKKVVCQQCSAVLNITRIKKEAQLLVRCPYCKDISDLNPDQPRCDLCDREFDFPVGLCEKDKGTPHTVPPPIATLPPLVKAVVEPMDVPEESINIQPDNLGRLDLRSYGPKKRSIIGPLISNLSGLAICGALGFLLWDKYGEEYGLKTPTDSQLVQAPGQPVGQHSTGTVKASAELANVIPPKLTSPSVELVTIEGNVAQALDSITSEVLGMKLFVEIKIKNLSPCKIDKVETVIQLLDGPIRKKRVKKTLQFSRPLEPNDSRFASVDFPAQDITGALVEIKRVWAGEQSDSTLISKEMALED